MARPFDMFGFYLGRIGGAGVVGALLVVAGLAYAHAIVAPRKAAVDEQRAFNARIAAQQALAQGTARSSEQRPALAPAAAEALRRLFDAAERAGVKLDRGEYRLTEVKDAHLLRYQLSLPLHGTYPQIRTFMTEVLNADPALALGAIQLRRGSIETPDLEALLNFTLYLEAGA